MKRLYRVTKNSDFENIVHNGKKKISKEFSVYIMPNNLDHPRFGISVSKKRGNAVLRNKVKRQIRSIIYQNLSTFVPSDYVIVVKDQYLEQDYETNTKKLLDLFVSPKKEK